MGWKLIMEKTGTACAKTAFTTQLHMVVLFYNISAETGAQLPKMNIRSSCQYFYLQRQLNLNPGMLLSCSYL